MAENGNGAKGRRGRVIEGVPTKEEQILLAYSKRYSDAVQAMQSGVMGEMPYNPNPTSPKHLRVGINVALVDHGSLVRGLVKKGVITNEEYYQWIAEGMEAEHKRYEAYLTKMFGKPVKLA